MPQTAASLDSNVRLPRAVRERSARIAKMTESQTPDPATATPPAEPAAITDPPEDPSSPTPEPSASPTPPVDPRQLDPQYWEQRFRVTQGMLERERRERSTEQEQTTQVISELREQLRTAKQQQPTPSTIDVKAFFTPEQIEQYGEEQCQTLARVAVQAAREQTQAAINDAMQPIREREERDTEDRKKQKQRAFVTALAELVPDFETIDAEDDWKLWLSQEDEASGYVRQELLNSHVQSGRADYAAKLFNAYKASRPAPPAPPPVAPTGRAGPPAEPPSRNVPALGYPSQAAIREHYKLAALGKKTDKEIKEFEARLQLPRPAA